MNFYPICLNCATKGSVVLDPGRSSASSCGHSSDQGGYPWLPDSGVQTGLQAGSSGHQGVQLQGFEFAVFQASSGSGGFRVASQKSGPVASDVPRFARQHTIIARKEPEISGLASWTPVGPLSGPRKPAARRLPARSSPEYAFFLSPFADRVRPCDVHPKIVSKDDCS